MQLFLIGDGSPYWPCPLRRAHTTCTLVVDFGSPSLFLLCVALRLYLITIFEVSIGTNSSTAITDKSVTLIPSSIHHCNFHLVNTTLCLLFNDLFAISPMVMFSLSFLAVRIEKCQQAPLSFYGFCWFSQSALLPRNWVLTPLLEPSFWRQHAP